MFLSISVAKFFEMNRKQCKEALDLYKKFVTRMEGVEKFFKVAEVSFTSFFFFVFLLVHGEYLHQSCFF